MKKQILISLIFAAVGIGICVPPVFSAPPDTCIQGYVWREAFKGDYVCVMPETRSQAAYDNKMAKSRYKKGGVYGPETCIHGYVWREAREGDHVCVTPETRRQAAFDNKMASERIDRNVTAPGNSKFARPIPAVRITDIMCPLQQLRAEITTPIPAPWWQTPQVGGVTDTRIQNIGGVPTLVCRYQAYGDAVSIMRRMPHGYSSCSPIRGGFRCR